MNKLILISIKERFVNQILSGKKTIELRKAEPKASRGDSMIIYTTQPKKAVTAIAVIDEILVLTPEKMWELYHEHLGIDKESYDAYYKSYNKAVGIKFREVIPLNAEILLSAIKLIHPNFSPPQTFKYLNKFQAFRDFKKLSE